MSISTVAFYYLTKGRRYYGHALTLIGLACLTRISAVMFWILPLGIQFLRGSWKERIVTTPLIIMLTICLGALVDSAFYGRFTLSWWQFFHWNIVKSVSAHYGQEPTLYHLKVTLPLMINTTLVHFLYGTWRAIRMSKGGLILATISAFFVFNSLQRHKETRFLAPIYPLLLLFCAFGAQQMSLRKGKLFRIGNALLLIGMISSQLGIALFYGRAHYAGVYEIVDKLRELVDKRRPDAENKVFFLTPCHVTPYQGYFNRDNVVVDFVKCHPTAVDEVMPSAESEARDQFQRDPAAFLKHHVIDQGFTHIVVFEGDLAKYETTLQSTYELCARSSKPLIPRTGGSRARGDALIYCKH